MQSIQSTSIYPWNTYNRPRYFCHILNSSDSTAFDIYVSFPPFFLLGSHIWPWCFTLNLSQGTLIGILEVLLSYPFYPNSTPILFSRKFIAKDLQKSRLVCTTPSFWKWPDARYILNYDTVTYQAELRLGQNLVPHILYKEISTCIWLLWSSTWFMYL